MFGAKTQIVFLVFCLCCNAMVKGSDYVASDFATELVSYQGLFGAEPYDDPCSVIGKPTTWIKDGTKTFACSLVYPAFSTSPDGSKLVVTLDIEDEIIVGFDHKVADDPANPYGIDLIVFGNSKFKANGWVYHYTDMDNYFLKNPTLVTGEWVEVSVAQYPNGPWYTFSQGPHADYIFPTNAFEWDSDSNDWGEELNWLKPVNPNLNVSVFNGLSASAAIDLYDGSAGGTSFDLEWLAPEDFQALEIDPATGRRWIQYVKVASDEFGEVDAFSDVASCGDYRHPYPEGDINEDCRVDYKDLEFLGEYWLADTSNSSDPAKQADIYEDAEFMVNMNDYALLAGSWQECTWECE